MVEESEKRFEALMDKLFHAPPSSRLDSNKSRQGIPTLSGRKRLRSSPAGVKLAGNAYKELGSLLLDSAICAQVSECRPWDRNDLFTRLSTFKSMTWFAKPQVVSPLECARRGWVNVDMDTIGCTSCDARILFSTPSAWTRQQVEKAAVVFSLKLESGHKLLCPWINNSCTEQLTQFPIMSRANLVEGYKKRLVCLSHIVSLPVILPGTLNNLGSSPLEQLFLESSAYGCKIPPEKSGTEFPGDVTESNSSIMFYQAQKLISLFGWEPHVLPYKVDFKDGQNESFKDANVIVTTGEKQKVSIYSLCSGEGIKLSSELNFDPSSVVLDCNLCGASVGLWAFSTIPRPVEYLRFVGHTVIDHKNISTDEVNVQEGSSSGQMHSRNMECSTNTAVTGTITKPSGSTIAGGLPPALLDCGATISLPIIGQNLRARFATEIECNDDSAIQRSSGLEEDQPMSVESRSITVEEMPATSGTEDSIAEIPQTVADGSIVDTSSTETVRTEDRGSGLNIHEKIGTKSYEYGSSYPSNSVEGIKLPIFSKSTELDPIKQHRHFCPWISSTGKFAPGWQQTLTALQGHKVLNNMPSSTTIEVDDPVGSVEKFFANSSEKRNNVASLS